MTASRITMSSEGPEFSRIAQGFGSSARWGKRPRQVLEHISECVALGVTTLDTAAIYGGGVAETLLGHSLAQAPSLRHRVQLVTKCSIGQWDTSLYHYDTSVSAKNYLRYSDAVWKRWFENRVQYFNRVQRREWLTN